MRKYSGTIVKVQIIFFLAGSCMYSSMHREDGSVTHGLWCYLVIVTNVAIWIQSIRIYVIDGIYLSVHSYLSTLLLVSPCQAIASIIPRIFFKCLPVTFWGHSTKIIRFLWIHWWLENVCQYKCKAWKESRKNTDKENHLILLSHPEPLNVFQHELRGSLWAWFKLPFCFMCICNRFFLIWQLCNQPSKIPVIF